MNLSRSVAVGLLWAFATAVHAAPAAKPANASDAEIQRDIERRLSRSKIAADRFQFKVRGGLVTWTGKTDVIQHKGSATRMARAAGAHRVDNQIQISEAAKQRAAANLEKGRRRAQLKRGEAPERRGDAPLKRSIVTRGG